MKKALLSGAMLFILLVTGAQTHAADYVIDSKGAHAFIQFRIKHLGYSWLLGRFNTFNGEFSYDEKNPSASSIVVNIDPASIDSNHAERDKHLRDKDFLDVKKYPEARFVSTSFKETGNGKAELTGNLTLRGVTRPVTIDVEHIGHGKDPWGGYRRGFAGTTRIVLKDFNINYDLGPASREVELFLSIEGIRK
jgi:polyisoprenoid-binding protein YceI